MDKFDWMETFTGKRFYPFAPAIEDICIEDIAHSLSMICRFGGHCKKFYSVAQHCCYVAEVIARNKPEAYNQLLLTALMHDAEEAYVGDIIRPIKRSYPKIMTAGKDIWQLIAFKFSLPSVLPDIVKWADNVMLKNEHTQLMHGRNEWPFCDQADGPVIEIHLWEQEFAETEFLLKFKEYSN